MKVTGIPFVIGVLGKVSEGLVQGMEDLEIRGRGRPSKVQHCWVWPEFWEESWRLEETCSYLDSSEKPSANTDVKNSKGVNNNDMKWSIA